MDTPVRPRAKTACSQPHHAYGRSRRWQAGPEGLPETMYYHPELYPGRFAEVDLTVGGPPAVPAIIPGVLYDLSDPVKLLAGNDLAKVVLVMAVTAALARVDVLAHDFLPQISCPRLRYRAKNPHIINIMPRMKKDTPAGRVKAGRCRLSAYLDPPHEKQTMPAQAPAWAGHFLIIPCRKAGNES